MRETARFYGILVPNSDQTWTFVHKTLHDYLAARFWVESGEFKPTRVSEWNTRAAYAACLTADATQSMLDALSDPKTLPAFAEMLSNDASFNHSKVATALIAFYSSETHFYEHSGENRVSVQLNQDFVTIASSKFLFEVVDVCASLRSRAHDTLCAYAVCEIARRKQSLPPNVFAKVLRLYRTPDFTFSVHADHCWRNLKLKQVAPPGAIVA